MDDYNSYLPFATYAVGEPFPFANPSPGNENAVLMTNTGFVSLVYFTQQPQIDSAYWNDGKLVVACYAEGNASFFIAHFPETNFTADFYLNPLKINPTSFDLWSASDSNIVMLMLVDEATNVLVSLRVVAVPPSMVDETKFMALIQRGDMMGVVDSAAVLDQRADAIMTRLSGIQMLQAAIASGPEWYVADDPQAR